MTTVYLVSSGSYSDWCLLGIYSTRELAEKRAALLPDANDIEERELDQDSELIERGFAAWDVTFYRDGRVCPHQEESFDRAREARVWDFRTVDWHSEWEFIFAVFARDEAHALKIAQDKRAEYLAKEAGVTE